MPGFDSRGGINSPAPRVKGRKTYMKWYRAEIENGDFEMIFAEDESDAISQYWELAEEHEVFNLIELDEDDNEVRTVC